MEDSYRCKPKAEAAAATPLVAHAVDFIITSFLFCSYKSPVVARVLMSRLLCAFYKIKPEEKRLCLFEVRIKVFRWKSPMTT